MPKSECVAGLTQTEPLPHIYTLSPTPTPLPKPKLACLLFSARKLQKCLWEGGRGKLGSFSFFESLLLDKRWRCRREQSDSTNYDADFCKVLLMSSRERDTMACGRAREINSNLCVFFCLTYFLRLYIN